VHACWAAVHVRKEILFLYVHLAEYLYDSNSNSKFSRIISSCEIKYSKICNPNPSRLEAKKSRFLSPVHCCTSSRRLQLCLRVLPPNLSFYKRRTSTTYKAICRTLSSFPDSFATAATSGRFHAAAANPRCCGRLSTCPSLRRSATDIDALPSLAVPTSSWSCFLIRRHVFALASSVSRCFGSRWAEHVRRCLQCRLLLHRRSQPIVELQAEGVPEPPLSPASSLSCRLHPRLPALPPYGRDVQETLLRRSTSRAPCVLPGSNPDC
jgi:hypothetical protein